MIARRGVTEESCDVGKFRFLSPVSVIPTTVLYLVTRLRASLHYVTEEVPTAGSAVHSIGTAPQLFVH
jgi:hypothetical protein